MIVDTKDDDYLTKEEAGAEDTRMNSEEEIEVVANSVRKTLHDDNEALDQDEISDLGNQGSLLHPDFKSYQFSNSNSTRFIWKVNL